MKVVRAVPTDQLSEQLSVKRLTDELEATKMRTNVWTLAEGSMMKHTHLEQEELYFVLDGSAELAVDGTLHKLNERDAIVVPPGVDRQLSNVGWGPLTFIVVAAPPVQGDGKKR